MGIRLLFAAHRPDLLALLHSVMAATRPLLPFEVDLEQVSTPAELYARVQDHLDDLILLDWGLAQADTPRLIQDLFQTNPRTRVVALLPQSMPSYRLRVWEAGACASIPQEHMDQEWLTSLLCVVHRAMHREADLAAEMARHNAHRSRLLRHIIEAQEECRRRLARDLHDEASQSLAAALVQVDTVEALLPQSPTASLDHLACLRTTLGHLHEEVHRVLLDLRPVLLEQKGLMAALTWYAQERLGPLGIATQITGGSCAPDLPAEVNLTLYRIGQEALANVSRHAEAHNLWLDLQCTGAELVLTVRDDGRGFATEQIDHTADALQGVGLLGIQERAWLLDGTAAIRSAPGAGTTVEVRIPHTGSCRP